jgi:hypothetical protein
MAALGEEFLLVSLSPDEGRNMRDDQGIGAAHCVAQVLDRWIAGEPLPGPKDLQKHVRKHRNATLEPALDALVAAGRVRATGPRIWSFRQHWLTDVAAAAAIRERLSASLASPATPGLHDACLTVLIHASQLWSWTGIEPIAGRTRLLKPPEPGPLAARARALESGDLVPDGASTTSLPSIARVIVRENRD